MSVKWPDVVELPEMVTIPEAIGDQQCFYQGIDRAPCCSVGHAAVACGINPRTATAAITYLPKAFSRAFGAVARMIIHEPNRDPYVTHWNDAMTPEQRLLVYAAAWLYLGVKIDRDFPEAVELAKRAKGEGHGV